MRTEVENYDPDTGVCYNELDQELVDCELCLGKTTMLKTKRCDRCQEVEDIVRRNPDVARQVLDNLKVTQTPGQEISYVHRQIQSVGPPGNGGE